MCVSCCILHSTLSCYSATALSDTSACQLYSFYTTTESPISAIDVILSFTPVLRLGTCSRPSSPSVCLVSLGQSTLQWLENPTPQYLFCAGVPCFTAGEQIPVVAHERAAGARLIGACFRFN